MDTYRKKVGITTVTSLEGELLYTGIYGLEVALDCHGCNTDKFTREHITVYMEGLIKLLGMEAGPLHFWDDLDEEEEDKQTKPETKGTSAVQFILTSNITIHTLDILKRVYVNIFSCKDFDEGAVQQYTQTFFDTQKVGQQLVYRH